MPLTLYNTLAREKQIFAPVEARRVTMYVCGPTVYSYAHIGNARAAVVFDVLFRLLRHLYPDVVYARNVTDIDDKIIKAAAESGESVTAISDKFRRIYRADMGSLGVLAPSNEPNATDHIAVMISMIERLIAKNHAYLADGHVLFHVPSFAAYGRLSNRDREEMIAGARVEVAPYKKDPADFVLWKPSDATQPGWESPWGRGRPGWHIECSAMIERELGLTIDIHGGGHDLIFPHHENEIAQSTCAHDGKELARFWLHNGFVNMDAEKMSKSLGNVVLVHDLLQRAPGEAIRLALLSAHYRQPLDWTEDGLRQARRTLDGLYGALRRLDHVEAAAVEPPPAFMAALLDDLNTARAIAELSGLAHEANTASETADRAYAKGALLSAGTLLGLFQQDPETWFTAAPARAVDAAAVERLIAARAAARRDKDFAEADRIRSVLADMGVVLEDTAGGTVWRLAD